MENSKKRYTPMMEKPDYRKSQGAKTPSEVQRMQKVPYASAIRSIMYAVRCTRLDVSFAQNLYSRFQQNPYEIHWTAVKTILKYLRNTKDMILVYGAKPEAELKVSCYADASFQTDKDDTKSQTGYVFVLNDGAIDWKSAKQITTDMSFIEVEYIVAAEASMEAVWMRKFIDGLGDAVPSNKRPMEMLCDIEPAIAIANDMGILKGARHFQRKYHYIRDVIQEREIVLKKVHTDDNVDDLFTKPMSFNKHYEHAMTNGIVPASSLIILMLYPLPVNNMRILLRQEIIMISSGKSTYLESTSVEQSSNSKDIVFSKGPSKALLHWYYDGTNSSKGPSKALLQCCLRVEASRFGIVEKSLRDEVKLLKERNAALEEEKGVLDVKVADLAATVKVREQEAADSDALVTTVKLQNDSLADQVRELEASSAGLQEKVTAYEKFVDQLEKFQDDKIKEVNDKLEKLDADVVAMVLHLEEKFYPHLLNTIAGRRWLLTHGMELAVTKCLNSTEYLSALGAAIGKAVEKGMQEGLSAGITHDIEGRTLTDIAAYNPSAKADYLAALHHLQSVNFSLLAELKSNKDASTETIMNLLRLEDRLADRLGLTASQPHVVQLMVLIHHSPDHRVIGASALSLSLDVSNFRVQKIKENLANRVSLLHDVFIPLSEPLSVTALTGTEGTSAVVAIPAGTTTALSVTCASTSVVRPISTDDYEIVQVDGQRGESTEDQIRGDNVDPFPNVDNVDPNLQ
ncbi:hypothetical protein Tco_0058876 [Tanacetum coccineum]